MQKDVFLICSNAMQYNAPDTVYFRQVLPIPVFPFSVFSVRDLHFWSSYQSQSIQVLENKNFENLRQGSDDNEPERKIVRRGRPPTKNLKK